MSYTFNTSLAGWNSSPLATVTGNVAGQTTLTVNSGDLITGWVSVSSNPSAFAITDGGGNSGYALGPVQNYAVYGGFGVSVSATSAPTGTGCTLSATFAGTTGLYVAYFSDGEVRYVGTLTNGVTTALSWSGTAGLFSGSLAGSPTTAITLYPATYPNFVPFYLQNANAGTYGITVSATGGFVNYLCAQNYSGVLTSGAYIGGAVGLYSGGIAGNNVINTGSISIAQNALLWGTCFNYTGAVGGTPLAGTAFNGRGAIAWGANSRGQSEDALANSPSVVSFGSAVGYDVYFASGMAFGLAASGGANSAYPLESAEYF